MKKINTFNSSLMSVKRKFSLLLVSSLLAVNFSMKSNAQTVVDVIVNSPDHTTLETAVLAANLAGTLSGTGPFTVFAPTDAAFAALPAGLLNDLLADIPALTSILTYHVASGKVLSSGLSNEMTITTLNGKKVTVTITSEGAFINGAKVTFADIEADNGVVHVIDAVLIPPTVTVVDIIVDSPDHTTLEAAVLAANLAGTLSGAGPFTVFAPTDAAFAALPAGLLDDLLADIPALTSILTYHVASGKVLSSGLSNEMTITTLNGKKVTVTITSEGAFINGAKVTFADIEADNGVVHVIDAVLVPPTVTVVDIIVDSPDHTTLEAAVLAANLAGTLSGAGPFTVFAPTDAAFAALPAGLLDDLLADIPALTSILTYHVASGKVLSSGLSNEMTITTLNGKKVTVTITSEGAFINGAKVTFADIEADNGVVHVIDAVLTPPADIKISSVGSFGNILTDKNGRALYFFTRDAKGISLCTGGCLTNWPIFYEENLIVGDGLEVSDFSAIDRGDGVMQSTYKGWPIYYFVNDSEPGDVKGDNVNGIWFVQKPDYTIMMADNQLVGNDHINYKGDYTPGDEVVRYFTDASGITIYTRKNDRYNKNKFTSSDFSNNAVWPIYEKEEIVVPSSLNPADFAVIDVYGRKQMTYKGWPLYFFGQDMMERGITKGVSVPSPGVWPVAVSSLSAAPFETVVDIVVNSPDHTTLEAAVLAANLAGTLSGAGPFTVFAPTDAAFAALPAGLLNDLLADIPALTSILTYHVASGKVLSSGLSNEMTITTLNGKKVTVTFTSEGAFINGAKVTFADIEADNGVVHVIDAVLIPPTVTVVDIIVDSPDHTTLEAAVLAANLAGTLSGAGPFTVFAPTDAAFAALPAGLLNDLLADIPALTSILTYHVASGKVLSSGLSNEMTITTLNGKKVTVTITSEGAFINGAKVTFADIEADNGVVHVIDAVLVPPTVTVVDIIVDSPDHTTLEAAVLAANLAGTLSGAGPFTVFAPTDAAFAALPAGLLNDLLADIPALTSILTYHVASGKVLSSGLSNEMTITTLNGQAVTVTITSEGAFINGAKVTFADIEADNGVVHVIDAVLVPSTTNVTNASTAEKMFSVYPNPASNYLNITLTDVYDGKSSNISIVRVDGAKVAEFSTRESVLNLDIADVKPGLYFVMMKSGSKVYTEKLIIK